MTKLDACYFRQAEILRTYTWNDDGSAVSITIPISSDITPAKVDVKIFPNSVRAGIKGSPPIVQGALYQEVDVSESMWQIERSSKGRSDPIPKAGTLTLHLWKKSQTVIPWPVLIVGPASPDLPESLDALSLFSLGEALETGRPEYSIQADGATALRHYAKAADLGCVPAMLRLARLFAVGPAGAAVRLEGLDPSPQTALALLHKAGEAGEPWGQLQLAVALYDPPAFGGQWQADWGQALVWALRSANQGCVEACGLVGLLRANGGPGLKADESEALAWLRRAAESTNAPASSLHQLALLLVILIVLAYFVAARRLGLP